MRKKKYKSLEELYADLDSEQQKIVDLLQALFSSYSWVEEVMQRNCFVYKFSNGNWRYIDTYKKDYVSLWCSHATRLIKQQPVLRMAFDEVKKVVGKIVLREVEDVEKKRVKDLMEIVAEWKK